MPSNIPNIERALAVVLEKIHHEQRIDAVGLLESLLKALKGAAKEDASWVDTDDALHAIIGWDFRDKPEIAQRFIGLKSSQLPTTGS